MHTHPGWFLLKSAQAIDGIGVMGNLTLRRVCKWLKTHGGLRRMGTTERDGLFGGMHRFRKVCSAAIAGGRDSLQENGNGRALMCQQRSWQIFGGGIRPE